MASTFKKSKSDWPEASPIIMLEPGMKIEFLAPSNIEREYIEFQQWILNRIAFSLRLPFWWQSMPPAKRLWFALTSILDERPKQLEFHESKIPHATD